VELLDLVPTMLDAANLEIPERVQGRSLLQVLRGEADASRIRPHVYSEYYNAWTHKHAYGTMFRTDAEKIIVYHGTDQGELYDLAADPDEFRNLWDVPGEESRKLRLMKACFDASVLAMDPEPPRRGPF
jgi:arylsulfatase A-like enzyme